MHMAEWNEPTSHRTTIVHKPAYYEVQKRFLGFLWWYNFLNIDGTTTGCFDTLTEAQVAINLHRMKKSKQVVEEYE